MARVAVSRLVAQMCPTLRAPPRRVQRADTDATYLGRAHNCRNFIFKRNFPIHKIFERSCEMGLWRMTSSKISEVFGTRLTKKLKGKLYTTLEQIEHGHHVFRVYCRNAFLKQYEKFANFLRNELCSNNLSDFGLKKGLDHLAAVREKFLEITGRPLTLLYVVRPLRVTLKPITRRRTGGRTWS